MQESESAPETATAAKPTWKHLFRHKAALLLVVLVAILGGTVCLRKVMPGADGRNARTRLPWAGENISITQATAVWKSSAGDERMQLRAAYYPQVTLEMGDSKGEGMIYLKFVGITGSQIGDTLSVRYTAQGFHTENNINIRSKGKTAVFSMAKGFATADAYKLHLLKQEEQLWRVYVFARAAGGEMQNLGYMSILPE